MFEFVCFSSFLKITKIPPGYIIKGYFFTYISVCLSVCLSIYLSHFLYLSIYLSIYLFFKILDIDHLMTGNFISKTSINISVILFQKRKLANLSFIRVIILCYILCLLHLLKIKRKKKANFSGIFISYLLLFCMFSNSVYIMK